MRIEKVSETGVNMWLFPLMVDIAALARQKTEIFGGDLRAKSSLAAHDVLVRSTQRKKTSCHDKAGINTPETLASCYLNQSKVLSYHSSQ